MCTAITFQTNNFYFGRTLDYETSFGEEVTITPRNSPLPFRDADTLKNHYAIIGMASVQAGYPLYYDAVNEKGLAMAELNFVGYADYKKPAAGKDNIAHFELIPWLLGQCASVEEAKRLLGRINITDTPFSEALPPAQLHWIVADRDQAITVESVAEGIRLYKNPAGVLTNNPPFDEQIFQLNNFMHLSPEPPRNRFSEKLPLKPYSRGMGALGLPGDLSSQSRFVRAAFTKLNSVCGASDTEGISQFFHILDTVAQTRGCCRLNSGEYEMTLYTSCCNADKGIYCYTTYENRRITAVDMHKEDLDGTTLSRFPLIRKEDILAGN